jgi:hypothetical protein
MLDPIELGALDIWIADQPDPKPSRWRQAFARSPRLRLTGIPIGIHSSDFITRPRGRERWTCPSLLWNDHESGGMNA